MFESKLVKSNGLPFV